MAARPAVGFPAQAKAERAAQIGGKSGHGREQAIELIAIQLQELRLDDRRDGRRAQPVGQHRHFAKMLAAAEITEQLIAFAAAFDSHFDASADDDVHRVAGVPLPANDLPAWNDARPYGIGDGLYLGGAQSAAQTAAAQRIQRDFVDDFPSRKQD